MKPEKILFELYNVDTEEIEAVQFMTVADSQTRNQTLRESREPGRWVRAAIKTKEREDAP